MRFFKLIKMAKYILIIAFICLVTLEATLQLASLLQNKMLNKGLLNQKAKNNGQINILCMGDSFTQGVGASGMEYSYPMQLQRYLTKKSFFNWKVFNSGVASSNSSELVHFIPKLFENFSVDYLCILIGLNDSWNYNLVGEGISNRTGNFISNGNKLIPWRLCFRTLKLFKMLVKYYQDVKKAKDVSPGKNNISRKAENPQDLYILGRRLLSENRPQEASEIFTKIISMAPGHLDAQIQLADSYIPQKRIDEAKKLALTVREKILNNHSPIHMRLAWIFIHLQEFQYAYDEIEQYKKDYPDEAEIYEAMGDIATRQYDYDVAEAYFQKAINKAPQRSVSYRPLGLIYVLRDKNFEKALNLLFKAYLLEKNKPITEFYLIIFTSLCHVSGDYFMELLNKFKIELGMDSNAYNELRMIYEKINNKFEPGIVRKNLVEISNLCLQSKVTPVFITYPMYTEVNKVIREFCLEKNELMIDAEATFNDLLINNAREKYFVPDNHLTNEGYGILASKIGEFLLDKYRTNK